MNISSRLDILLYAHDGRGLGHVSRSIAIGLSIRRLFPELKIALITGSPYAQMLTNQLPLEIIKLPSYNVKVQNGESYGAKNNINFTDHQLSKLRSELITVVVNETKPRCILVDHLPLGKREELREIIQSRLKDCIWIYGIRAVPGDVDQINSIASNADILGAYSHVFWYGDSNVVSLGKTISQMPCNLKIEEVGYVSRAYELEKWNSFNGQNSDRSGCVVSFSWITEHTALMLQNLVDLLDRVNRRWGDWYFFLGKDYSDGKASEIIAQLHSLPHCNIESLGSKYLFLLLKSSFAIVTGGYNTLTDLIWSQTPGIVVGRSMLDKEQSVHIRQLSKSSNGMIEFFPEEVITTQYLETAIRSVIGKKRNPLKEKISGSEATAKRIANILGISNEKLASKH